MAIEDDFDEDGNVQPIRGKNNQTGPIFYLLIGIAIGFVISMIFSPGSLPWFGSVSQYEGKITQVDKFVSQDLRASKVVLRINDANIAVCTDGDNCLGYQKGDEVKVTCINKDCQATKK